jgi:hypothetical protein
LTLAAGDDKQDVEAPSCETLPEGRDRLRFDDVEGFDLQPPAERAARLLERALLPRALPTRSSPV